MLESKAVPDHVHPQVRGGTTGPVPLRKRRWTPPLGPYILSNERQVTPKLSYVLWSMSTVLCHGGLWQWKQYARGPYLWESLWFGWLLRRDVTEAVLEKTWREGRSDSVQADLERADEIKSLVLKTQADLIFYAHPDRMEVQKRRASGLVGRKVCSSC